MELWQYIILIVILILSVSFTFHSYKQCKNKKNSYGLTPLVFNIFGAFVHADMVVFGIFWILVSFISLILNDFILFLLVLSVFWLIRSLGETIYWFLQQFIPRDGNEPKKYRVYPIFHNDSIWFVHQIYWQCISVVTIITTLYIAKIWLDTI